MRRNKLAVYSHFVWGTWDRQPAITDEIQRPLYRCIGSVCQEKGCAILAIGGVEDHVHLLVTLPSTLTMADLMHDVKGTSSRLVMGEFLGEGGFRWQGGYGAFSVSPRDRKRVIQYTLNQKQHHAEGSVWPAAEETWEEVTS